MINPCINLKQFFALSGLPLLEAKMLAEKVLGVNRAWLIAHDTDQLSESVQQALQSLVERRLAGEPMAYILGEREFMGLLFQVNPKVLIPRPDTETLVEAAIQWVEQHQPQARVLDLGTGSGAIAVSIAHYCPKAQVSAIDISPDALEVAERNAISIGAKVNFIQSHWFEVFHQQVEYLSKPTFDLIVSNPPYIEKQDQHLSQGDLRFEPDIALTDFADGLTCYREIIAQAPEFLNPNGVLMVEHGWNQADSIRHLLEENGFSEIVSLKDLSGVERVHIGVYRK
ncbi:peptide chain release factor N(5)-glutamine methyltransferase [Pelistega sp. MC2]|uniref:peptide chain release factor N(5)-glutamine methyltransferase n=1 Tax=Pelistega sp. MC2 TaxID=1720297 RepID=UPI000A3F67EF|nr:peptide chain release factor N(5)-glutamine methyltransferase [Pelistega sp. MC2]